MKSQSCEAYTELQSTVLKVRDLVGDQGVGGKTAVLCT